MGWPEARFRPRPRREDERDPRQHGEPPQLKNMSRRCRDAGEWDAAGIVNLNGGGMLLRSVVRWLGGGKSSARLQCCSPLNREGPGS